MIYGVAIHILYFIGFLFYVDIFMLLFDIFQIRKSAVEHVNFYVLLPLWSSIVTALAQLELNFDRFDNFQLACKGYGLDLKLYCMFSIYIFHVMFGSNS